MGSALGFSTLTAGVVGIATAPVEAVESTAVLAVAAADLMHPLILAAHSRPKTARRSSCSRRHAS